MKLSEVLSISAMMILFIIVLCLGTLGIENSNNDNKILGEIIEKDLKGNEAVKYCINNYGNLKGDSDNNIPKRCYNLINTRNNLN